jgi:cell division protein FtsN
MSGRVVASLGASRQRGNTVLGLIIGVVLGLGIAAVVALYVTRATVPFVNKQARAPATITTDADGKLPDPNRSLYAKDAPAAAPAPTATAGTTVIAPPPPNLAPGADGNAPVVQPSTTPDTGITTLQAGAFSNTEDAESMRGRLALLGFDSRVQPAERDGAQIFRVRLGPYARIDDLNRIRQRLIENGIEATLVAPGR